MTVIGGSCCPGKAKNRQLVVNGHLVGFSDLDALLEGVRAACPVTIGQASELILSRLRESNYVPGGAEQDYVEAVLAEFVRCFPEYGGQISGLTVSR
ncbi:TPA: hypothetical protein HA259_02300 [Thermoplasmata archaeon]|nr:hypothetical protein [Thermoplasmata archaeon]